MSERRRGPSISSATSKREILRSNSRLPASSSSSSSSKTNALRPLTSTPASTSTPPITSSVREHDFNNPEKIYAHFWSLGMPPAITLGDFTRILDGRPSTESPQTQKESSVKARAKATGVKGSRMDGQGETESGNGAGSVERNTLREALEFLSVHFVGRQEAGRVRAGIDRARKEHVQQKASRPQSRIKAPSTLRMSTPDVLENPRAEAGAEREAAHRILESARREYGVEGARVGALDKQHRALMVQLRDKRRLELLLRVLEKRESARITRLGVGDVHGKRGLGALVRELRKESSAAIRAFQAVVREEMMAMESSTKPLKNPTTTPSNSRTKTAFRYKYTADALANLHARHRKELETPGGNSIQSEGTVPMAAPEQRVKSRRTADIEKITARLDSVLKRLGMKDGAGVEKMRRTLVSVARRRAASRQYATDREPVDIDDARLEAMHNRNEDKRRGVQARIERAVALGWVCEVYVDSMTTFRAHTAPALADALFEETRRVSGYVDGMRVGIVEGLKSGVVGVGGTGPKPVLGGWAREVRDVLGTTSGEVGVVANEVREAFERVSEAERRMARVVGEGCEEGKGKVSDEVEGGISIANVTSENAAKKLLDRKVTKAEYGFEVVREVREVLLDGIRKL
ncbi:hypothetical protein BDN70DRAFT_883292 [Pholiota conissans]|uniref:Uncharacterized protein n=1 Tax=Pholiota conissans TaxID=109636 RepID=A0A9P5YW26_9AGAR|nr:hypothetical protein BDN70DRAFT_883292 [Pholiota conissans]